MATIAVKTTSNSNFIAWLDAFAENAGDWELSNQSSTSVTVTSPEGDVMVIRGSGFTYDPFFGTYPRSGTATSAEFTRSTGEKVLFNGFSIPLMDFADAAEDSAQAVVDLFGNVTFRGNIGADIAQLSDGNDTLIGGSGADTLRGGNGNDTYYVDNARDIVVEGENGGTADRVLTSVTYTMKAGVQVEKLSTTAVAGTTALSLTGNEFAQLIQGNAGANRLDGKLGADKLTGFGGNDSFIFSTALGSGNVDTVTDFSNASGNNDTMRLSKTVFAALTGDANTTLTADQFVANTSGAATNKFQHIIYETDTGKVFYDADGNGAGAAVQFAQLGTTASHPTNITAADFFLV